MTGKNNSADTPSNPVEAELDGKENSIEEKDGALGSGLKSRLQDIPPLVQKAYIEIDGKYYFAGRPDFLAFEDRGRRIKTNQDNPRVAGAMVDIAEAKGWKRLQVRGKEEFRREVWLQAAARGIKVKGYTPREEDLARLKKIIREQDLKQGGRETEPVNPPRDQLEAKAEAIRNEREDLIRLAKDNPDLVNEIAAIKMGEKISRNFTKESDRQRFMGLVRERVADNYLKGRETAVVKVREERTIERSDREEEAESER